MTASTLGRLEQAQNAAALRAHALGRFKVADATFRTMTFAAALVVLVLLLGVPSCCSSAPSPPSRNSASAS